METEDQMNLITLKDFCSLTSRSPGTPSPRESFIIFNFSLKALILNAKKKKPCPSLNLICMQRQTPPAEPFKPYI